MNNRLKIWTVADFSLQQEIPFPNDFHITSMIHPDTYLNKILLGTREGSLQLWNIKTGKHIFTFPGWGSQVRCMAQSTVVDVVAIGLDDGRIILHNLKYDKTITCFTQIEGAVTCLTFRTGYHSLLLLILDEHPILASGNSRGSINLWDLEKKTLQSVIKAHDTSITSLKFLFREPVLVSTGGNSIKLWIFDQSDGSGRLLRSRSGHSETPTRVRFYGPTHFILSSSRDRTFRVSHPEAENRNAELSQRRHEAKKASRSRLPSKSFKLRHIRDFDSCESYE